MNQKQFVKPYQLVDFSAALTPRCCLIYALNKDSEQAGQALLMPPVAIV